MKVVDYKAVSAQSPSALAEEVNKLIKQGYQPYGLPVSHSNVLVQALVRTDTGHLPHPV